MTIQDSDCTRASLLSRAKRQDSRAWSDLVQLYGPLIAHWCRKCGLSHQQAADGVQEVFAVVVRSLDTFLPQRESGSFRAWLWTVTCNKVRDMHRRNHGQLPGEGGSAAMASLYAVSSPPNIPDVEPTEDLQLSQLMARALQQVQAEFETKTWQIFQRTVVDQLPTHLVAEQFSVSPATVRKVRSRVLRRLRQQLGDISTQGQVFGRNSNTSTKRQSDSE